MIIDILTKGIKQMIEQASTVDYNLLSDIEIYLPQEAGEHAETYIKILDSGTQEHPTLDGHYTSVIDVGLRTIPAELELNGVTESSREAIAKQFWDFLSCSSDRIVDLNDTEGINVFDFRPSSPRNDVEDGNLSIIGLTIVYSKDSPQ